MGQSWNDILSGYELTQRNDDYELMLHNPSTNTTYRITAENFIFGLKCIIGEVRMYCGTPAPNGWLVCDGTAISRTTYADLFGVIGTTFGVGDGSTTFNLPDFQGRSPIGVGSGSGLTTRSMGDSSGEEGHVLVSDEMPSHKHYLQECYGAVGSGTNGVLNEVAANGNYTDYHCGATGGNTSHNNMHPFLAIKFIVYTGVLT